VNKLVKWISIANRYSKISLDRALAPLSINSSHHMFIINICENEGISQDRLTGIVHIDKSNVTRALRRLEELGFIEKRSSEEDRRTAHLFSTDKGRDAYARIADIMDAWAETLAAGFGGQDKERLLEEMKRVAENAADAVNGQHSA